MTYRFDVLEDGIPIDSVVVQGDTFPCALDALDTTLAVRFPSRHVIGKLRRNMSSLPFGGMS